ncbi:VgrG protein [Rhodovulum sp. P5]|uniref:type VI secretion system Vgr family protein n=1 Tax=Rhodovulum sp. P5 TaxID=1564506 RepID=UPI0009C29D9D|nr:type VI secretion system tip protein TssI/VgrG [Rhodovulum sp. P5]ARE41180.1 VgrG protein [Rhodovulum sp. P5]
MPDVTQPMTMTSALGKDALPVALRMVEGFSTLSALQVDFVHPDKAVKLEDLVGTAIGVTLHRSEGPGKQFSGHVITAEALGSHKGNALYTLEVRPWLWFLSRTMECRIFQDKTAMDIITEIIGEYGFSSQLRDSTSESFRTRVICVQYRETDLDFVSRLMEEEGIYYFFEHEGSTTTMVLADGAAAHSPIPATLPLEFKDVGVNIQSDHVYAWQEMEFAPSGKVTLRDYDFEKPKADLTAAKTLPKGKHSFKDKEVYDYPGLYRETGDGDRYAKIKIEGRAWEHRTFVGATNVATVTCGGTLKIDRHDRTAKSDEFIVIGLTHMAIASRAVDPTYDSAIGEGRRIRREGMDPEEDYVDVQMKALPKDVQYRHPQTTPCPIIAGVQTAIVTGPSGEEIHTDQYGRIRIQFHWDRLGGSDETSTCWVRHMTPWSGKNWGMIHIPRIGQEVVVQFEEGDPDRPLVVGMLYNADTMPPYGLDANKTQQGIKTNSSKGGGGFNELMFEDKKGEELVRFQSEKDYQQIVKNDATITVGLEKKDKGDMSLTVQHNLTELVKTGNHRHTVAQGDQTLKVSQGKQTETIKSDVKWTVEEGDVTRKVSMGSVKEDIDMGDLTVVLGMGNETRTMKMGDFSLKTSLGKINQEAMQSIELKCMGNSIKIDPTGITIKGIMVKIEGTAMLEAKAPMSTVKGDALLILKGGMTLIN